jgi:hypothetical protein
MADLTLGLAAESAAGIGAGGVFIGRTAILAASRESGRIAAPELALGFTRNTI